MITFGFRNKFGGLLRAVVAIALGAVMVSFPATSLVIIVKIVAAFLIASGVVSLIFGIVNRANGGLSLMITNTVVDIVLGIIVFMFPAEVASIVMLLIGVFLMVFGIFQMSALFSASRVFPMGAWSFVLPALCTVGGALVVFHPFGLGKFITLVAGIALLVYGVSDLISTWKMRKAMKEYEIRFNEFSSASASGSGSPMDNVKDVDYEKVGEDK